MILDGKKLSSELKKQLKEEIEELGCNLSLAVIRVGEDPASLVYVNNKEKVCNEVGINFIHIHYNSDVKEEEITTKIKELNNDDAVNGIIVQLPLPENLNSKTIINQIKPNKDVDGLTYINAGKLINEEECLVSCTPKGIVELLDSYNIEIEGKHAVIVGRSNLVGKPLINLLLKRNATVTVCHSKTVNLEEYTKQADILIVAVGKKDLITQNMVKDGSVVIDVGINRVDGKLYGDVCYNDVFDKVAAITPVPGGVGPMTVIMLMKNVLESYKLNL